MQTAPATPRSDGTLQFLYDLDGRVCDLTANGYLPTNDYVLDAGGGEMTELAVTENGSEVWQHTNVTAGGMLLASYDVSGLHFLLNDPLGTRRAQTDSAGVWEQGCQSLPFGDALSCTENLVAPTERHFTGKERDTESGLDYFGARYYASNMGRFMSPDWSAKAEPVPYAKLGDPQTLNLYAYVGNNPLSRVDADGHVVAFDEDEKNGKKLLLQTVSKKERGLFEVVHNSDTGKNELHLKDTAGTSFKGTHTEGFGRLLNAISSDKTATINVSQTATYQGADHNVSREDGGGVTVPDGHGNVSITVSPKGNPYQLFGSNGQPVSDPVRIIMGHELLGHGVQFMYGGSQDHNTTVIPIENQLRQEQGLQLRGPDPEPK